MFEEEGGSEMKPKPISWGVAVAMALLFFAVSFFTFNEGVSAARSEACSAMGAHLEYMGGLGEACICGDGGYAFTLPSHTDGMVWLGGCEKATPCISISRTCAEGKCGFVIDGEPFLGEEVEYCYDD